MLRCRIYVKKLPSYWYRCLSTLNQENTIKNQIDDVRFNEIGIQMISEQWRAVLFGEKKQRNHESINKIRENLVKFNFNTNSASTSLLKNITNDDLQLPKLLGQNLNEHFKKIAGHQADKYVNIISELISSEIPAMPSKWLFKQGWTRYDKENPLGIQVEYPHEEALVFDVEILVKQTFQLPTLAVALSDSCWYSWCSNTLIHDVFHHASLFDELIPLEKVDSHGTRLQNKERIVVCHNAGFDRSFIREQYLPKRGKLNFIDTMCLHIACSGLTSEQRMIKNTQKSNGQVDLKLLTHKKDSYVRHYENSEYNTQPNIEWLEYGSANNLRDVHEFYCPHAKRIQKEARNVFVSGSMMDVRNDFQNLMTYCANDVRATLEILMNLFPLYMKNFPNPITLSGMFEMGNMYLPVNENWLQYIENCESAHEDLEHIATNSLIKAANESCSYFQDEKYKNNLWLCDLDWSTRDYDLKKTETKSKKEAGVNILDANPFENLLKSNIKDKDDHEKIKLSDTTQKIIDQAKLLPKNIPYLCGYPKWYTDICEKPSQMQSQSHFHASLISTKLRITPKLLRLTWHGYPLHYIGDKIINSNSVGITNESIKSEKKDGYGWGYLVPKNINLIDTTRDDLPFAQSCFEFFKVNNEERKEKLKEMEHTLVQIEEKLASLTQEVQKSSENIGKHTRLLNQLKSLKIKRKKQQELKEEYERNSSKCVHHKGLGPIEIEDERFKDYYFFRIPHKDGSELRVGNPLSKDFIKQIKDGTLSSFRSNYANLLITHEASMSYWMNNEKRIKSQLVVWLPNKVTSQSDMSTKRLCGAILPRTIVAGTITRRAVEPTWLTASNYKKNRIGSELKAMINAPEGYHFVGADVDSQELWIASLIGDSHFNGIHGATPIGWMNLQGKKSNATDMHSRTAQIIGISRDHAKVINYGRIYGAGKKYAEQLLLQFNPSLTQEQAREKATIMYETTKGKKTKTSLSSECDAKYTPYQKWVGGSESEMFNELEAIAQSRSPKTPVLESSITRCLEPDNVSDSFMTSRINWVVQSSAVDYLHLMLVSMKWLMNEFNIEGRFSISIHDEVRYLVKSEDRYKAALALQITNLLVRSLFSYQLGFDDLPLSIAFFSEVDIDKCLRKAVNLEFVTPSNPLGLTKGYNIPQGESLDIYALLDKLKSEKSTEICT